MGLMMECIIECFSYKCLKTICKNNHFITCNKSSVYRHRSVCEILLNSDSFFPPICLQLPGGEVIEVWSQSAALLVVFVNIICTNEPSVQFF